MRKLMKDAIRLIRVYHDMNQSDVAARVGLSKSYISELESGTKKITMEVLEKYSRAFDIPMSSVMLFAEKSSDRSFENRTKEFVADKVVRMLDWLDDISRERPRV